MDGPVCKIDLASVSDCENSTVAPSSCASDDGSDTSTSPSSLPDWFFPPPGLDVKVRNTFVHFAETSLDERTVQSMPRSMFRKCLLLESLFAEPGETPVADVSPKRVHAQPCEQHQEEASSYQVAKSDAIPECALIINDKVVIQGLKKCPAFNGLTGTVQAFDTQSGRYSILLSYPIDGNKTAMLRRENCQLVTLQVGTEVVIEGLSKCLAFNGLQGTVQHFDAQSGRYKILLSSPEFEKKTAMLKRENCRSVALAAGTEVVIEGLWKYPAFNGLRGTIQSFEEQSERYNVLLSSGAHGCKSTRVRRKNLRLSLPN
jgi:hypothetical protein